MTSTWNGRGPVKVRFYGVSALSVISLIIRILGSNGCDSWYVSGGSVDMMFCQTNSPPPRRCACGTEYHMVVNVVT